MDSTGDSFAMVMQADTGQADTLRVEIELRKELRRIQEELERTRERLKQEDANTEIEVEMDMQELMEDLRESMKELQQLQQLEHMEGMKELEHMKDMKIQVTFPGMQKPFLGVAIEDLTYKDAYEKHYDRNYGVYVRGVVTGSPADRADIRQGDIIMALDGEKVRYTEMMRNMVESKSVGDTARISLFRNEDTLSTTLIFMPQPSDMSDLPGIEDIEETEEPDTPESPASPDTAETAADEEEMEEDWDEEWPLVGFGDSFDGFLSAGYGGGSWIPVWSMIDVSDVNNMIGELGFERLPESGLFMQGGGGKGPIGKGWFIGGMGAGYDVDRKMSYEIQRPDTSFTAIRRMKFSTGYGGVTLDKRYRLNENMVAGFGFMLGGGDVTLEVSQTSGHYDWDDLDEDLVRSGNSYMTLEKSYLTFQPKAMYLYRLTRWLGIRAEVGYMMGYSFKTGWNTKLADETFDVSGSPDSQYYNGFTFTVGPWFGF